MPSAATNNSASPVLLLQYIIDYNMVSVLQVYQFICILSILLAWGAGPISKPVNT
jgi:hypothetical protein